MTKLSSKIVNSIKTQAIKPKPRWQFQLQESGRWAVFGVLIFIIGLISALLWYFLADIDLGFTGLLIARPAFFGRGPGLIIAILLIIAIVSFIKLRKTKRGYRYNIILIISIIFVSGLLLAAIFNGLGYGQQIDRSFSKIPFYQNRAMFMSEVWQQPSQGRIAGEIVKITGKSNFILKDLNSKEWSVSSLGAIWRHNLRPELGLQLKMLGSQLGDNGFEASDIRPWMPKNGNCGRMNDSQILNQGSCGMMQ